ncbi:hypothetical protein [Stieleria sp.]|uniref:hypothetical protein n=1 Tax=Stieleria sp. TaxID=2795976 RepID=UPI003567B367
MAASGWHYTTDYDNDANVALRVLRRRVFESGDYGDHHWSNLRHSFWSMPLLIKLVVGVSSLFVAAQEVIQWVARGGRGPRSIEEAVDLARESGTHSILDIDRCSQTPDFGVAFPLSFARRRELFGTDKPTLQDWESAGWLAPAAKLQRWTAVYFTIYEDGNPAQLAFVGVSGD